MPSITIINNIIESFKSVTDHKIVSVQTTDLFDSDKPNLSSFYVFFISISEITFIPL